MKVKRWSFPTVAANAWNFPPEEYGCKAETQRNWRGSFTNGGTCGLIRWSAKNLTSFN